MLKIRNFIKNDLRYIKKGPCERAQNYIFKKNLINSIFGSEVYAG